MANVFVTGVTGFIGKRLLVELLGRGETVTCLVRPQSVFKIRGIIDSLKAEMPGALKRVTVAEGDISLSGLGLETGLYERLCGEVTEIYHSAAVYDLAMTEEASARINTGGTRNVLDFAASVRNLERFHHI
ncbi:SDR family oxidoreductase, partial [Thermodesulfobacteriota bacterium]